MKHETRYDTQRRHTPWTALCSLFALAIPFAQLDAQQLTRDEVMSRALQFFHDSSASSQRRAGARGTQSRSESELEMIASSHGVRRCLGRPIIHLSFRHPPVSLSSARHLTS